MLVLFLVLAFAMHGGEEHLRADVRSLVEAERAFARLSVEKGMMTAFLEYLAGDAVLFRPGPVNGKEAIRARGERPVVLDWEPSFADVAASGDFGYTTGPWTLKIKGDTTTLHGHFVSVWRKEKDGWKVAVDLGIGHGPPAAGVKQVASRRSTQLELEGDGRDETHRLLQADRRINAPSLDSFAEDVRVYRNGSFPIVGRDKAKGVLTNASEVKREPFTSVVSASNDMGYTYGSCRSDTALTGYYVRIWRKVSRQWQVVLDIVTPVE